MDYRIKQIISVYESNDLYSNGPNNRYLQIHPVEIIDGKAVMKEGHPADIQELINIIRLTIPRSINTLSIVDPNLIAYSPGPGTPTLWWSPPQIRNLFFHQRTAIPTGKAPIPGIVFFKQDDALYVFAIKGDTKPGLTTELYEAPFPNISSDIVCLGGTKSQISSMAEYKTWEKTFWETEFTEPRGKELSYWRDLIHKKAKKFPEDKLISAKKTIQDLLNKYNASLST